MRNMLFIPDIPITSEFWLELGRLCFPNGEKRYYCSSCDKDFTTIVTPTTCPLCGKKAESDPQGFPVVHKSSVGPVVVGWVFPFFVPEDPPDASLRRPKLRVAKK